jgi:aldehyde:ferredoxin oxidoreductase
MNNRFSRRKIYPAEVDSAVVGENMVLAELKYTPEKIVKGATDRVLKVDLSSNKIEIMKVSPKMKDHYLGGRGFCLKLVWDGTNRNTRYDSEENVLAMAGGLLGAEPSWPGSGKFIVGTISPLTGSFVDSNLGGHFAPLLKLAGFDAIAVTGKAEKDVIIVVDGDDGRITVEVAPDEEGSLALGKFLIERHAGEGKQQNIGVATAGVGGENTLHGIVNSVYYDGRRGRTRAKQAGRGGTGTVMRLKGLKAIVAKSNLPRGGANNPADITTVRDAGSKMKKLIKEVDPKGLRLDDWGTTVLVQYMDKFDLLPVNNYKFGKHPDAKNVYEEVWKDKYFTRGTPDGCYFGCTLACTKGIENFEIRTGPHAGEKVGVDGPEYETTGACCSQGIFDADYTAEFNWYCDEYGVDTISVGITFGFVMDCFERGFLTREDTDGLDLNFGNIDASLELLHRVAYGRGFGREVGKGIRHLKDWIARRHSERTGKSYDEIHQQLADIGMECKGMEFSVYITKESLAQQGGYGFALKGAQHDEAWLIFLDQINNEMPTFKDKAKALRWFPLLRTWFNAMGLCKLPWIDVRHPAAKDTPEPAKNIPNLDYFVQYVNGTLGTNKSLDDMLFESERLYNFQKLFNLRQGYGLREHDQIPGRAKGPVTEEEYESRAEMYDKHLEEKIGIPINKIKTMSTAEKLAKTRAYRDGQYEKLCDAVYKEKGWDNNAIPKDSTMKKFGILDAEAKNILKEARKREMKSKKKVVVSSKSKPKKKSKPTKRKPSRKKAPRKKPKKSKKTKKRKARKKKPRKKPKKSKKTKKKKARKRKTGRKRRKSRKRK